MAAEGKPTPSIAGFPCGIKMRYSFSTAHTIASAIARQTHWEEGGNRLLPLLPTAAEDACRVA